MKNWIKKFIGIKDFVVCQTCSMVYEADGGKFDNWCPEHRKPYMEQYELEQWAAGWARRKPEEARKTKAKDEIEQSKIQDAYSQALGNTLNQNAIAQKASQPGLYGLGDYYGKGL